MTSDFSPAPMRAVLRADDASPETVETLRTKVAGVPLFERHLLALRQAGIHDVIVSVPSAILPEVQRLAHEYSPRDVQVKVRALAGDALVESGPAQIEQSLITIVDPRLVAQLVRLAESEPGGIVCADAAEGEAIDAKSPYRVGVPEADEARFIDASAAAGLVPIGLAVRPACAEVRSARTAMSTTLAVGRYYWQRLRSPEDAQAATWKVLLATMKPTDGFYAQTNRRVSLRISRAIIDTGVTPNAVSIATLLLGILAGCLLAQGRYAPVVAGSVVGWIASMLDGVDGELARARFQASEFGHWLEMVCDYAFYFILAIGLGEGFHKLTGNPAWLIMGCAAAVGVVFGFAAVARLKRGYSPGGEASDFYSSYERAVRAPTANPFARITSHLTVFATRAALPYYLVLFAVLGLMKVIFVMFFVVTQVFWLGALVVERTVFAGGAPSAAHLTDQSRSSIPPIAGSD